MKIVVSHLTRMQKGFICVAGVDLATRQHVRPMLRSQMHKAMLSRHGGPFDIGRIVDLGWTRYSGTRPETEDYLFHASEVRVLGDMAGGEFWDLLASIARPKLGEIFGKDLVARGTHSCAVDVGRGIASLGCYVPAGRPQVCIQRRNPSGRGRIRIEFMAGSYAFELGVTDIRLYGEDHVTPDPAVVASVAERLQDKTGVILGVGLTRPYQGESDEPPRHWLQVNNLHFQEDPCWQLG